MDGTQARLKQLSEKLVEEAREVERVDGTQARLKQSLPFSFSSLRAGGKGGWDSGEIET